MQRYDKSSKWLIEHHGDSILRLAGLRNIVSWKPLQPEVVQPRQLPDGLLEVQLAGHEKPILFILELATRAAPRLNEQIVRDMALVYLDRRALPEVLALVLHEEGGVQADHAFTLHSEQNWTRWQLSWRMVELWRLPAEELLAADDVGLIPWAPLARSTESPETILRRCRQQIDERAKTEEHEILLTVTRVLASLRYNDAQLLGFLGGKQAMLEFPAITELVVEAKQEALAIFLEERLGQLPEDVAASLLKIQDKARLDQLIRAAAKCADFDSFRAMLNGSTGKTMQ